MKTLKKGRVSKRWDFRSDTVTLPSKQMLEKMLSAKLGDDVFQEDIETNEFEEKVAKLTGKESALFCVSGTLSNQLALRSWLRGALEGVVLDKRSHIYKYENAVSYLLMLGYSYIGSSRNTIGIPRKRKITSDLESYRTSFNIGARCSFH